MGCQHGKLWAVHPLHQSAELRIYAPHVFWGGRTRTPDLPIYVTPAQIRGRPAASLLIGLDMIPFTNLQET